MSSAKMKGAVLSFFGHRAFGIIGNPQQTIVRSKGFPPFTTKA